MPTLERLTVTLNYEDSGGAGPALVFLHGWCDGSASWRDIIKRFRVQYRCIAADMRGHGASGQPRDHAYFLEALSADVLALCESLSVTKPVLVGHSFGGLLAAVVASRFPGFARAVVVEDQQLDLRPQAGQLHAAASMIFSPDQHMAFRDALFGPMVTSLMPPEARARIEQLKRATPVEVGQALWAPLFTATDAELGQMVARWIGGLANQPSLLVDGQPDEAYYAQVRTLAPAVQTKALDCGHWTHLERQAEFCAAVTRFLDQL